MKYIILAVSLLSSSAFAGNVACSYDVRGYDMTERHINLLLEDSYETQKFYTTPETCVTAAIRTMKKYNRVQYKVKGKTMSYQPSGLRVAIEINGNSVNVAPLNDIAESDQCVQVESAFEYGSNPYSASFKHNTDC